MFKMGVLTAQIHARDAAAGWAAAPIRTAGQEDAADLLRT